MPPWMVPAPFGEIDVLEILTVAVMGGGLDVEGDVAGEDRGWGWFRGRS